MYSTLRAILQDEIDMDKEETSGTSLAKSLACLPEDYSSRKKDWSRMKHNRLIENRIKKRVKAQYRGGKFYDLMDKVILDEATLQDAYDIIRLHSNVALSLEKDDICFTSMVNELKHGTFDLKSNTFSILSRNLTRECLVLPNLVLKVIQEAVRVALEVVYRPHFSKISHGCRSGRGHRSALKFISHDISCPDWWFTLRMNKEADKKIVSKLINLMEEKIEDPTLFSFIHSMFEVKVLNLTFGGFPKGQGLPQEGVLSPILMNIYLDALDRELFGLFLRYECLDRDAHSDSGGRCSRLRNLFRWQMKGKNDDQKGDLELRMHACRFMDEILISIKGPKDIASRLKDEVQRYVVSSLYIEIDDQIDLLSAKHSTYGLQFLGMVIRLSATVNDERVRAVHKLKDKVRSFASQKQNIWDDFTVRVGKKWLAHGLKRLKESEIRQLGLSTPVLDYISQFRKEGMKTDHWFKSLIKMWLQDVNAKVEAHEHVILGKYIVEPALPQDLREAFYNFQKQVEEYACLETDSMLKLLCNSNINVKCGPTNWTMKIEAPTSSIMRCLRHYGVINPEGYTKCVSHLLLQDDTLIICWFSGLVRRWLKWYSDLDNFQDVKTMIAEYVRKACVRTLAVKHRMLENDIERKFQFQLDDFPLTGELGPDIASTSSNSEFSAATADNDDEALTYGISYSGLCILSLAKVKVPSRPLHCSIMGCFADSPSIYTLHVKEQRKFPGWKTGFSSAVYFGLNGRRVALCKQHVRDIYLGHVSLQSIDFGALSR